MSFLSKMFATSGGSNSVASDDHWFFRTMTPTHAGTRVSENNAMTLPVVYSAVGIIADSVAQLPIAVMRAQGDRRDEQRDHAVSKLLNLRPNPYMTAFTLRDTTQSHMLLWGNGYQEIRRLGNGTPVELWPLLPDRTDWHDSNDRARGYYTTVNGQRFSVSAKDMLHVPALGFDGIRGHSPIWMARQAIGLGLALEEYAGRFFSNDSTSGGFLEHPGKLSAEAKKNVVDSMSDQGGLTNAHRLKVLEEGMKFNRTTIPPEEAQFLQSRAFQVQDIARMFRVPLFMLQDQSKDTAWGTGISQMLFGFLEFTLTPWLLRWEQELTYKLFSAAEIKAGFYIKHNVNALLRGDAQTRAAFYTAALNPSTGFMSRQEVRALEDLNPDDTDNAPLAPAKPSPSLSGDVPAEMPATSSL